MRNMTVVTASRFRLTFNKLSNSFQIWQSVGFSFSEIGQERKPLGRKYLV